MRDARLKPINAGEKPRPHTQAIEEIFEKCVDLMVTNDDRYVNILVAGSIRSSRSKLSTSRATL